MPKLASGKGKQRRPAIGMQGKVESHVEKWGTRKIADHDRGKKEWFGVRRPTMRKRGGGNLRERRFAPRATGVSVFERLTYSLLVGYKRIFRRGKASKAPEEGEWSIK